MDIKLLSVVSCTLWSTGSATAMSDTAQAQERQKPTNILFCIADDAGHMSAYGTPWVHTPAFDRVAREGVLLRMHILATPNRLLHAPLLLPVGIRGN